MATEKINQIGLSDLGRLGLGEHTRHLYFDGQRIHTDAVVSLTSGQTRFALAVGAFTILAAIATTAYSGVYIYDTLIRVKPSVPAAVTTTTPVPLPAAPQLMVPAPPKPTP